jgi:LPS-assembly protein
VSLLAAVAAAGLLARAAAAPAAPAFGGMAVTGDVQATADRFSYEVGTGRILLEGNVVVRRGAVTLHARSATYDPQSGEVRAAGGVLLTDATRAISADAIRVVLGGELEAEGVLAFVKDRPVDLSGLRTIAEARAKGHNRVTFTGEHLRGREGEDLRLENVRLTLCDCPGGGRPSWEVTAREADVAPGKRAILRGTGLRIAGQRIPLLALPWLYVPLSERQSGLLLPTLSNSGSSGFTIAQPVYLTLGRSADTTLTPEYAFGPSDTHVADGKPSVRGPGARLELRWAPAEGADGRTELAWLHDLDAERGGESGDRWGLNLSHGQRIGGRTSLVAALHLAGDQVWVRDTVPDLLGRSVPYRRSDVLASYRRDAAVAEAVASYVQPLSPLEVVTGKRYGFLGSDFDASSRLGSAAAALVPYSVGPLRVTARGGAARFGPLGGGIDPVSRPAATRADLRAQVDAPVLIGDAFTVMPYVRGTALGYSFDGGRDPGAGASGVAGAAVATEVSRRFGTLRHAFAPRLEWRAGTRAQGEVLPFPAYDPLDRATGGELPATPDPFNQLRAVVETRLQRGSAELLRAEIGQDLDLRAGRFAETFATLAAAAGPVRADARVSFFPDGRGVPVPPPPEPSSLDRLTELSASLSVHDRRGDSVRAGFASLGPGGPSRLVAALDPLFDVRPARAASATAVASAGLTAAISNAVVSYDASLFGRTVTTFCPGDAAPRTKEALDLQQQAGTLAWQSSCRCFRIVGVAALDHCGTRSYNVMFELAGLGGGRGR